MMKKLKLVLVCVSLAFPSQSNTALLKEELEISSKSLPCKQMFYYIEKYTQEYDIPRNFAYGIAFYETGYSGPNDIDYEHDKKSSVGALGPMQIMPATSKLVNSEIVSKEILKKDIGYNVKTSMKYLRRLNNKYKNWKVVFGVYNTGKPKINKFSKKVFNYKIKWQ